MGAQFSVLIVDDDYNTSLLKHEIDEFREQLKGTATEVRTVGSGREAIEAIEQSPPDVVLLDIMLDPDDMFQDTKNNDEVGTNVLRHLKEHYSHIYVIMLTNLGNLDTIVGAMKAGADDYIVKSVEWPTLASIKIQKVLEQRQQREERLKLEMEVAGLIGSSKKMKTVYDLIQRIAPTNATVLIRGESGSGKEPVARALHRLSAHRDGRFVPVNCTAIPKELFESKMFGHEKGAFTGANARHIGLFEIAHNGTLFLDEIGDMPLEIQAKLLRVLDTGRFTRLSSNKEICTNARIIAATHKPLEKLIDGIHFREDLFYRLNVITIPVPPLRDHKEDIPELVRHFLHNLSSNMSKRTVDITPEALDYLMGEDWRGNVRALRNRIERAVVLLNGDWIKVEDVKEPSNTVMSPYVASSFEFPIDNMTLKDMERVAIQAALEKTRGNKQAAGRLLGISAQTITRRIKEWETEVD